MHWQIKKKISSTTAEKRREEILNSILLNRNIRSKAQKKLFLNPPKPKTISPEDVKINKPQLRKAIKRINKAISKQEEIVIYGDYDADGICATAILWETLYALGAKVSPFIPERSKHGYGLSVAGIKEVVTSLQPKLIITVDNGIVANKEAKYIAKLGIDLIISDHHVKTKILPQALAIVHSIDLSGSGVAWILAKEIVKNKNRKNSFNIQSTLDLATIGTVADLVPLTKWNRVLVKWGLVKLRQTKRPGLISLLKLANIDKKLLDTHHISFIIGPRLNAMGRLEHALDSLRLLCTKDTNRANRLATTLSQTNQSRQELTSTLLKKALALVENPSHKLLIVDHKEFHEGIIGLIAGKIVEEHYRPTIVISKSKSISKASARSISGVNIIELIRKKQKLLINAGGHPMAAGFTIKTENIQAFRDEITKTAEDVIKKEQLQATLQIDCEIKLSDISWKLFHELDKLKPFGIGNPRPKFALQQIKPLEILQIGRDKNHLKLLLPSKLKSQPTFPALWFNKGKFASQLSEELSLAFSLDENIWKGKHKLQLLIKDAA